jgi:hypothetical protein
MPLPERSSGRVVVQLMVVDLKKSKPKAPCALRNRILMAGAKARASGLSRPPIGCETSLGHVYRTSINIQVSVVLDYNFHESRHRSHRPRNKEERSYGSYASLVQGDPKHGPHPSWADHSPKPQTYDMDWSSPSSGRCSSQCPDRSQNSM